MGEVTSVKVLKASICRSGTPIYTLRLTYPRIIHDEFLTHRAFSRNASSNRAIPTKRLLEENKYNYFSPSVWEENKKGMSSDTACSPLVAYQALTLWNKLHANTIEVCEEMEELGVHKQFINYLLLPFQYITVIVTATDWSNFLELRCAENAHPEIRKLALLVKENLNKAVLEERFYGAHMPFIAEAPLRSSENHAMSMVSSVAKCARVTYNRSSEDRGIEADKALVKSLLENKHMSPFEHIAFPVNHGKYMNLTGWQSLRFFMEEGWYNPLVTDFLNYLAE